MARILDLFAGLGGERRRAAIEARGHEYVTLDLDPAFGCNISADILTVTPDELRGFDFIWASPPCESFSVASIGTHWDRDTGMPKTEQAQLHMRIVQHTRMLCDFAEPRLGFLIENPRGMLRKLPIVRGLPRHTVTYCQYGETRMKPTDLFGHLPGWEPKPPCVNGSPCHERAPRGARTGTQGIKGAAERAVVPWALWDEILTVIERRS